MAMVSLAMFISRFTSVCVILCWRSTLATLFQKHHCHNVGFNMETTFKSHDLKGPLEVTDEECNRQCIYRVSDLALYLNQESFSDPCKASSGVCKMRWVGVQHTEDSSFCRCRATINFKRLRRPEYTKGRTFSCDLGTIEKRLTDIWVPSNTTRDYIQWSPTEIDGITYKVFHDKVSCTWAGYDAECDSWGNCYLPNSTTAGQIPCHVCEFCDQLPIC